MGSSKEQHYYIEELDDRVEFFFWDISDWLKSIASSISGGYHEFVAYIKTTYPVVYHFFRDCINSMKSYFDSGGC